MILSNICDLMYGADVWGRANLTVQSNCMILSNICYVFQAFQSLNTQFDCGKTAFKRVGASAVG